MVNRIVKYGSQHCQPCKLMDKNLNEFSKLTGIEVEYIDVEEQVNRAIEMGVRSIPSTFFYDNDELLGNKVGLMTVSMLEEFVKQFEDADDNSK